MTFEDFISKSDLDPAVRMGVEIIFQIAACAPLRDVTLLNMLFAMRATGGYAGIGAVGSDVPQYHVVGGMASVSDRIAEYLGDAVRLSSPVTSVSNWQEGQGPVRLETPSGTVEADRVIMAMGGSLASQISYHPELPELRKGLHETVDKDHCLIKTHTTYERPFWRDMNASGQIVSPDGVFNVSADVTPPYTAKGVLVTLVRSPREGDGKPMSPEDRKAATIEVFAKCFGDEARSPTDWVMQDWLDETYTRGDEDIWSRGLYLEYGPALRAPTDRLIWAGTETSPFWCGYLDGAVRGGRQAALAALRTLAESRSAN
jgi:monoamine oxidase